MPRNGSGIYSQPFDDVDPDTTIESAVYNGFTRDVELELNSKRPIIAGGTGADDADEALRNLSGEKAAQLVTNYDSHVWLPGSFRSATAATAAPVAGHAFAGICYLSEEIATGDLPPTNQNLVIEARDCSDTLVPGRVYVREKKAGVWSAWVSTEVRKTGDTMTGDLTIDKTPWPTLYLKTTRGGAEGPGSGCAIVGQMDANKRWQIMLGNDQAEANVGGSPPATLNQGSNFSVQAFDNAGAFLSVPLWISRAVGSTHVNNLFTGGEDATGPGIGPAVGSGLWGDGTNVAVRAFSSGSVFFTGPLGTPNFGNISVNGLQVNGYIAGKGSVSADSDAASYFQLRDNSTTLKAALWYDPATVECSFGGSALQRLFVGTGWIASSSATAYKPGGGAWLDGSDARIKTVQGDYLSGLAEVLALNPVRFTYNGNDTLSAPSATKEAAPFAASNHYDVAKTGQEFIGLIAQEVEGVMPELVTQHEGYIDGVKVTDMRDLDPTPLIYALLNAVKELATRVEQLENPT